MSDYSQNLRVFIVGCPNGNRIAQKLMTKLSETADKIDTIEKQRDALLAACEAQHEAIDRLFAMLITVKEGFCPSKSGQPWEAILQGNKAIADAK